MEAGLRRARLLGYEYVVVLGAPAYYSRFGFVPAARFGLGYPDATAAPYFMALELVPGVLGATPGVVRYHPAFSSETRP